MTPRPAARNAARKSSAAPAVAVPASTAMGPPYAGAAPRGRTVSAGGAYHVVAGAGSFPPREKGRGSGGFPRAAAHGLTAGGAGELGAGSGPAPPPAARGRAPPQPLTPPQAG